MKELLFYLGICAFLFSVTCNHFPSSFEQVGYDKIRVLDFVYQNKSDTTITEAAPGDSIRLTAYFSGCPVVDIQWKIAHTVFTQHISNRLYETNGKKMADIHPLPHLLVEKDSPAFTQNSQVFCIDFKIPDSIMYSSHSIPDTIFSSIGFSKSEGLTVIDSLIDKPWQKWLSVPFSDTSTQEREKQIIAFTQALSMEVGIIAVINGLYEVESTLTVRYNRYLKNKVSSVFVNKNPKIRWAGIIKTPGNNKTTFTMQTSSDRDTQYRDTLYCLYSQDSIMFPGIIKVTDTLAVESDFSYFVTVDSGIYNTVDLRDSAVALTEKGTFFCRRESWCTQWFYRQDSVEISGIDPENYVSIPVTRPMNIAMGKPVEPFLPPKDKRITHAVLWVQVFDTFFGERFRPRGSCLKEFHVYFNYVNSVGRTEKHLVN